MEQLARTMIGLLLMVCTILAPFTLTSAQVTSTYVRPATGSPDLPIHSLLKPSREASNEPTQVWVSLHGANHMQISWITSAGWNASSTVDYSTSRSGTYITSEIGSWGSYSFDNYTSGNIHYVVIGPLLDDTTYFYRLGGSASVFSFKTPPPAGPDVPIKFVIIGNVLCTHNSLQGDLSYADSFQPRWDSYGELVSPLASSRPWMVTEGNHDSDRHPTIEPWRAYNARWRMPYELSGSNTNLFYSFEVTGVHFLMLGSYVNFSRTSDQYNWLKNDLAKVDRTKTPWLIGVIHIPWYNSNVDHQGEGNPMLESMEDMLVDAKVDMIFAGHVHAYERMVRMYKGEPDNCGILYINIGDDGNRQGLSAEYLPQPEWSAFREASYGHGQLTINGSTSAVWRWNRNQDDESIISDSVDITSMTSSSC